MINGQCLRSIWIALFLCFVFSHAFADSNELKTEPGFTEISETGILPVLSPAFLERKTLKLKLPNHLEVYIISDPNADQSAAGLSVETGSWDDPAEYPGIAHFNEHMLFLGTKKFPVESEYSRYVSENGGTANAFTQDLATTYMFSINNQAFPSALDRFSSFFKEPLFNPSGVSRELHAIDQEYANNLDNDDVRQFFVMKELGNPEHPDHQFDIGNSATLSKVSQDTLKDWYQKHYSANLMHLVVYSPLPIDELKALVLNNFSTIPDRQISQKSFEVPLTSPKVDAHMIYVTPLKNIQKLTLAWELPQQFAGMLETKPEVIVGSILGDEGNNSLLAELKREHLAETLKCGGLNQGRNYLKFYVQIELTSEGLKQIDTVIERCFQAINNIKQKKIPYYIFEENQRMAQINYQYPSRDDAFDTVMDYAPKLILEDLSSFPEKTSVIQKFDEKAIMDFVNYLTPQHCQFYLLANPSQTHVKTDQKEKWMGISYAIKPISAEKLESWSQTKLNPAIGLPEKNPFIPQNLTLINPLVKDSGFPHPKAITDNEMEKIYYSPDNLYLIPEIYYSFEIKSPQIDISKPKKLVLADLYAKTITEALNRFSYPARTAGLKFEIKRSDDYGLSITVNGYSEKAPILLDEILKQFNTFKPSQELFDIYKESLKREYQNFYRELSIEKAKETLKNILYKEFVTEAEKAKAIKDVTYNDFIKYSNSVFNSTFTEGLLYGNLTEDQAEEIGKNVTEALDSKVFPLKDRGKIEVVELQNKGPYYLINHCKAPGNAVILAIENPPFSFKNRAAQQILGLAIEEPFYSALRTKQQTGYLVYSWDESIEFKLFNFFADQSNSHDVRDLLARFELTLEQFVQEINHEMTEERYMAIQQALLATLSQPPKSILAMGELLKKIGFKFNGDFDWMTKRIDGVNALSYMECLSYAKEVFGKKNKKRVAILIKGKIPEENEFHFKRISSVEAIKDLSTYTPAPGEKTHD